MEYSSKDALDKDMCKGSSCAGAGGVDENEEGKGGSFCGSVLLNTVKVDMDGIMSNFLSRIRGYRGCRGTFRKR